MSRRTDAYTGQPIEPARANALAQLHTRISEAVEGGAVVPCLGASRDLWIADDVASQRAAADACMDCPLMLGACLAYITNHPERSGTWAGLTPAERTTK